MPAAPKIEILITGASGNVGGEIIKIFAEKSIPVAAAVSAVAKTKFSETVEARRFDFTDPQTFPGAMRNIRKVFLMRPPALSNVRRDIFPFIEYCRSAGVEQLVLLSLLGAETLSFVPHRKIELEILRREIPYTFLRPSFFMQNLSTTHRDEIRNGEIFVPAGRGKTSFVDARDVASVAFAALFEEKHLNRAYSLTGSEALSYNEAAQIMSNVLRKTVRYSNPSVFSFFWKNYRKRQNLSFVLIMTAIYLTARFGKAALITKELQEILRRPPILFEEFVEDYALVWK